MTEKKTQADYWTNFWLEYTKDLAGRDEQSQVLRTRNKKPVDIDTWKYTLKSVENQLDLKHDDELLDLCCGNGLFSSAFSSKVSKVTAVDLSYSLIDKIQSKGIPNIKAMSADIREVHFENASFSKVLWYAGIQYISESEIVEVLKKIKSWLKPNGILLIGDIPDRERIWEYFNSTERKMAYFDNLAQGRPIIGTWIDPLWIKNLCEVLGFSEVNSIMQDEKLIYADFRFDLVAKS